MEMPVKKYTILKPLLSEKSLNQYRRDKVCVFWVDPKSTKKQIQTEFKLLFGISPLSIQTVVSRRNLKVRSVYGSKDLRKVAKKAYVGIGENTLDIFENIK